MATKKLPSNNTIITNSINNTDYQVESYLGKNGVNETYIVNNKNDGSKYICKSRQSAKQADYYEKNLYKYLARNINLSKFINPLQTQIIDTASNMTHSFFPIMNGISLSAISPHLKSLDAEDRTILTRIIIKNLLEAIGHLHKIQIIHNDIRPENIIVQLDEKPLAIKLINFDNSCGKFWNPKGQSYLYKKCNKTRKIYNATEILTNNHNRVPHSIQAELQNRKKNDVRQTGLIALELLLGDVLPWTQIRNAKPQQELESIYWQNLVDTSKQTKDKIQAGYTNLILANMIMTPFQKNINPAKYTVDKIIILEKYA